MSAKKANSGIIGLYQFFNLYKACSFVLILSKGTAALRKTGIIKTGQYMNQFYLNLYMMQPQKTCTSGPVTYKPARSKWSDYRRAVPHPEQTGYRIPHDI